MRPVPDSLRSEAGSAVLASVLVMPLVLLVTSAMVGVVAVASRAQQLRTCAAVAAHEAAVQPSLVLMRAAASRRVHHDFPGADVALAVERINGISFVRVHAVAQASVVPGLHLGARLQADSHAPSEGL